MDVSASQSQRNRPDRAGVSFTAAEREALASLLACLSDTARQLKPDAQAKHVAFAVYRLPGVTLEPARPTPASRPAEHDPLGLDTLARAHLLNLPPPTLG